MNEVDMQVVKWIKEHLNVLHNELPLEFVDAWRNQVASNKIVYSYALFGYIQCAALAGRNVKISGERLKEYLEEFEAKLALRVVEEYTGIHYRGLPLFCLLGADEMKKRIEPKL